MLHSEVNLLIQHIIVQDQDGQNNNNLSAKPSTPLGSVPISLFFWLAKVVLLGSSTSMSKDSYPTLPFTISSLMTPTTSSSNNLLALSMVFPSNNFDTWAIDRNIQCWYMNKNYLSLQLCVACHQEHVCVTWL